MATITNLYRSFRKRVLKRQENVGEEMGNGASSNKAPASTKQKKDKNKKNKAAAGYKSQKSFHNWDVMISYSHKDKDIMMKLKESLEHQGLQVWVDVIGLQAGVDFLNKIGQAIVDAKMFISLLSIHTVKSKYCQDELALAYISNKPIFPIGLDLQANLTPDMDTGMRLQLARYEWTMFLDEDEFGNNLKELLAKMQPKLAAIDAERKSKTGASTVSLQKREMSKEEKEKLMKESKKDHFWERHFKVDEKVPWDRFVEKLKGDFSDDFREMFSEDDYEWLLGILARELNIEEFDNNVTHDEYMLFCKVDDQLIPFWERVKDQAIESYTMREVFDMESSVRVEAIENLAKFRSQSVIEALIDLLSDKDNNVKTVAAISLARTGAKEPRVIRALLRTLSNKDRLVRESGCLALGHLKCEEAVPKIVHLWRNDVISSVRDAAQVALEQIGGDEANKAIHMTKVLSDEIKMLMEE